MDLSFEEKRISCSFFENSTNPIISFDLYTKDISETKLDLTTRNILYKGEPTSGGGTKSIFLPAEQFGEKLQSFLEQYT